MVSGPTGAMAMVRPSGRARAASATPMVPPAPAVFLTTTLAPRELAISSCMERVVMSVPPPAENGTTMVTDCAAAVPAWSSAAAIAPAASVPVANFLKVMVSS